MYVHSLVLHLNRCFPCSQEHSINTMSKAKTTGEEKGSQAKNQINLQVCAI